MKINMRLLLVAFPLIFSTNTAIADWEYVETSGTSFNKGGIGYLKDGNSSWEIPASRAAKSYNLTVNLTLTDIPLVRCENSVPWNFTTVKTVTVKDQPESDCKVVDFTGCTGVNISELIAPDCLKITNKNGFYDCDKLKKVVFPNCIYLGWFSFSGCDLLESVYLPALESAHTSGSQFSDCIGLKSFVWNMPNKQIPPSCFSGCSSLMRVDVQTPVSVISGNAFKDIAPGAEIFLPVEAPETIGALAFANTKDCSDPDGPVQRIYLQGNYDDWLDAFKDQHHIIPLGNAAELAAFNLGWSEEALNGKTRQRAEVIDQMKRDEDICRIEDINNTPKASGDDKVTLLKRGLLAYAVRKHDGSASYSYGCWIFKVPPKGFSVVVR